MNVMESKKSLLLPKTAKILAELGENIKLARLRRKLSMEQIGERAKLGRTTLWAIEKEFARKVALGFYAQVLFVLGLEKGILLKVAVDDTLGRKLQDAKLLVKQRAPKKAK